MRRWWTGLLVGLVACGAPVSDRPETPADEPVAGADTVSADTAARPLASTLSVRVTDDSVHLRLDVTNVTSGALSLEFPSTQRYDFAVTGPAGEDLWRWSAARSFGQMLGTEELAAGGTLSYEEAWAHAGAAGAYAATAWLTSTSHPVELRTPFELPEE